MFFLKSLIINNKQNKAKNAFPPYNIRYKGKG